ncbi:MAG: alpha-L-fucosidase [Planctomycetes bacterium]|nr:alpha-L-fucosidase [Planctomycetota bacterium]
MYLGRIVAGVLVFPSIGPILARRWTWSPVAGDVSGPLRAATLCLAVLALSTLGAAQDASAAGAASDVTATMLWYDEPGKTFPEALPLGNGRLGAMLFGNPAKERVLLNEETVWTGGPYNPTNPAGAKNVAEIRRLVLKGDYARAHKLFGRHMMGTPVEQMKYQPLGDLWLEFPGHESFTDYRRELNLDTAVASVRYRVRTEVFTREVFVSPVDQVIVVRVSARKPGQISFVASLTGYRNTAHSNYGSEFYRMDGVAPDSLQLHGRTSTYLGVEGRVRFHARARFIATGGEVLVGHDSLTVKGADAVIILIPAATNFVDYRDVSASAESRVQQVLERVADKTYEAIKADHIAAHQKLFRRLAINLSVSPASRLPTDERLTRFAKGGDDPQLAALLFQYARYLLISSSRPGTKPANLQGIWNEKMNPSWDSKFTANINLQMNYWPAEVANLSDCAGPLIDMLCEITGPGSFTARKTYGARGWVLHQNTDIWWATAPMDGPYWGAFSTGGAWLCTQLWEHYQYQRDPGYLLRVYPVLKGAALFFVDTLVEHPTEKVLVTCPASSPENLPTRPGNRKIHDEVMGGAITPCICAGPTVDMQVLRDLFGAVIQASLILDRDRALRTQLAETRRRLAPMKIGRHGQLQEWLEEWDDPDNTHRHFSHLYGLFPGCQIDVERTPELARAAKKSVSMRGDHGTGFSMAWKMGLWARLRDGDRAHQILRYLVERNTCSNLLSKCYDTPQVDGAFGACAGIAEMLIQSHADEIHLLPALPKAWPDGRVSGLRARGGFELDLEWKASKLVSVTIHSAAAGPCKIRYGDKRRVIALRPGEPCSVGADRFSR